MNDAAFLAADWGTTNLRAWVLAADGSVLSEERFAWGVGKLPLGEAARRLEESIRPTLHAEHLPAVLCGMIGSTLGMVETPYLDCPVGMGDLASATVLVEHDGPPTRIAPGVRCRRPDGDPDVMRGEETKVLGWVSQDVSRAAGRRLICMPGTHPKWVLVEDGRIVRFLTAMTGELFAVLSRHSVLKSETAVEDWSAFLDGARRGHAPGALASKLFSVRSRVVGGSMAQSAVRDYMSGVLIGDETALLPGMLGCGETVSVDLLGEAELCRFYAAALSERGVKSETHNGDEAVIAGLAALYRKSFDDA